MSLAEYGLRIATVRALRGKTFAGALVLDEPGDPVAGVIEGSSIGEQATPLIAVFTNLNVAEIGHGSLLVPSKGVVDLTIQVYLPPTVSASVGGNETSIKGRDGGGKFVVDIIERQVAAVLLADQSPWAVLARHFRFRVIEARSQSFVVKSAPEADIGVEIMAREIVLRVELIGDPSFGEEPSGHFATLLTMMESDTELSPLAPVFRQAIAGPEGMQYHEIQAALMGVDLTVAHALGLTSAATGSTEAAPVLEEIDIVNLAGGGVIVDDGSVVLPTP